jgi:hypothetical protein
MQTDAKNHIYFFKVFCLKEVNMEGQVTASAINGGLLGSLENRIDRQIKDFTDLQRAKRKSFNSIEQEQSNGDL